jgi:hypothetical protein
MRITLLPTSFIGDPEATAMLQAFYSRSHMPISDRLTNLGEDLSSVKESLKKFYINYNHSSIGEVVVISKDFDKAIKSIPIGKKLLAGKKLHFSSQKGVDVYVSLEKKEVIIKYRIKIDTQFSVYGIKDLRSWVKEFVVKPCLVPNVSLRAYLKDSL